MLRILLFGLLAGLIGIKAYATPSLLVVTEEWPPFNYVSDNNHIVGSSTKVVKRILEQAKIDYELELVSWARAYRLALTRPNTLIYSIFQTKERKPLFTWYCPINRPVKISLFRLASRSDIRIEKLEDAKRYVMGVIREDYASEYMQSQGFVVDRHLLESTDEKANIQQLFKQRVDLTAQSEQSMLHRVEQLGREKSAVVKVWESIDDEVQTPCMALSLNSEPELRLAIDTAFRRVQLSDK